MRHRFDHWSWFSRLARDVAHATGHPIGFAVAAGVIVVWAALGPLFEFSDTWQLVINTGTTIVTFLMVFLIQNTQNRDSAAVQLKLDELIRATHGAHNALIEMESLSQKELDALHHHFAAMAEKARARLRKGTHDTDVPRFDLHFPDEKK